MRNDVRPARRLPRAPAAARPSGAVLPAAVPVLAPARVLAVVLAVLAAVLVLAAALWHGGAAAEPPPGVPSAGTMTRWTLPVTRMAAHVAAIVTTGFLVTAVVLLPASAAPAARLRRLAVWAAGVWTLAVLVQLAFVQSETVGKPLPDALGLGALPYLSTLPQQRGLLTQAVVVGLTGVLCRWAGPAPLLCALAAPLPVVLAGHAGGHADGYAVAGLILHVGSVTVWAGGLIGLCWLSVRAEGHLLAAVTVFSRIALGCWMAVGASGIVVASARLASLADVPGTPYGRLLAAKAAGLLILGGFGWWHRRVILPRLGAGAGCAAFARWAAAEGGVMLLVLAIAAALASTPPPG
jgi:putative copper export protein